MKKDFFRYCPRCTNRLRWIHEHEGDPVRQNCPRCDFTFYDNPVTSTEAFIIRDGWVVLVKRASEPKKGWWDVPGGFMEKNETPEQSVVREVREETRMRFTPLALLGAYNDVYHWKGRNYPVVVLSYVGTAKGVVRQNDEIATLRWVNINRLPKKLAFKHMHKSFQDLKLYLSI